jgi:hypothetical protein
MWAKLTTGPQKRGRSFRWPTAVKALVDDPFGFRNNFLRFTFLQIGGAIGQGTLKSGEKIDALQPLPTGLTLIWYPLYSLGVTLKNIEQAGFGRERTSVGVVPEAVRQCCPSL